MDGWMDANVSLQADLPPDEDTQKPSGSIAVQA